MPLGEELEKMWNYPFFLLSAYRYGMVWYGMVWYGMVWYGMVWYGMVWWVGC